MARRPEAEIAAIKAEWMRRMEETEFRQLSGLEQGKQLGVADETIYRWARALTPEDWDAWLRKDNKFLAPKVLKVDDVLYKQAMSGDVQAIKLWKESKQGWSPTQINKNLNKSEETQGLSYEEMLEKAASAASPELLEKIAAKKREAEKASGVIPIEEIKESNG